MRSCASGSSPRIAGPIDAVDDLRDHIFFGDAGEAVADQAVIGLDLDVATRERRLAIDADEIDAERDVERNRGDARDLHDAEIFMQ